MSDSPMNVPEEILNDPDIGALTKEELNEFQRVNAKTILSLEDDIKFLERKIKHFGPGALPSKNFEVQVRPDGTNNVVEIENRLSKEIEETTARLKETIRLTGVTIEKINRRVLEINDSHCKTQFSLELFLLNRKVHLTYTLEEPLSMNEQSDQGGKVTWFEIKFEEDINKAVGADVAKPRVVRRVFVYDKDKNSTTGPQRTCRKRAAGELAIHSVFSLLKSFLQWQTHRDQLLKQFTDMYPENVSQLRNKDDNKCLKIINPKHDHPEFVLEWDRKTVNAIVKPDIRVEVNAPKELIEMDSRNILASIPEMFASMTTTMGLDKALDYLIQLVATDGQETGQEHQPVEALQPEQF